MRIHDVKPPEGSRRRPKRVGRGIGSGHGKTSGRGQKGQGARSGGTKGPAFEGGQMPLVRRVPKRGFKNLFRKEFEEVKLEALNRFEPGTRVTPDVLRQAGLVKKQREGIKILGNGDLQVALEVSAHRFTQSAREKIEAAGGKVEVIG
ncbi:50S ribosomal protein L15 [Limnochorda pilosa]|uniref:Large ribosomal subunit protein uL15 n=1 Tax=Limnochorda pilosa TaxID=1555112 RepID=A0A0K2SQG4_LIMPI|nr:50S ribosomal protein L15 [Limnochorda pilosa]BAS29069.1 50S ribosomal protein L15 [Limnochorda pilosa]